MRRLLAALLLGTVGCSFAVGRQQALTVTASDPRAELYVDGEHIGTGAGMIEVRRDQEHAVLARLGDRAAAASVRTRISGVGIADIVGCATWIVPCVGLLAPGFYRLQPPNVVVVLPPGQATVADAPH